MAFNVPPTSQSQQAPHFGAQPQPAPQPAQAPQGPAGTQNATQPQGQQDPNAQQGQGQENPQALQAYVQNRLQHAPREAQQFVLQALLQFPKLPTFMGITIHPAIQDLFQQIQQQAQQQQQGAQQNSPGGAPQGAPQGQNAQAPQSGGGAQPAMATPDASQGQ